MINRLKRMVRRLLGEGPSSELKQHVAAWRVRNNEALASQVLNLENGIVARFDALNARLDADQARLLQAPAANARDHQTGLAQEIDRLDSYLVYHVSELKREIARLAETGSRPSLAGGAGNQGLLYSHPDLDVIVMNTNFDLAVPAADAGLLAFLVRHGPESIEPEVRAAIQRGLAPGGVAIDIGANIGLHTLAMALRVGSEGRIFALEPNPRLVASLQKSLRLNRFSDRVSIHAKAATDRSGPGRLFLAGHSPESSLYPVDDAREIEIETITIDEVVPAGTAVDLIKIDVEGAEPVVYRGMRRILDESPDLTIIMEWSRTHFLRSGHDPRRFLDELSADGFQAFRLDAEHPGEPKPLIGPVDQLDGVNLLFTRSR